MSTEARVLLQRRWRVAAVAVAMGCGAFSAEQLWPLIRGPLRERSALVPPADAPLSTPSRPFAPRVELGVQSADPATARLGTDDVGVKNPRTLVLVDASPGVDTRDGTARLGTDPRNPQTYVSGALLSNGARLTEIYRDYVVLERNGESMRLYVAGRAPGGGTQDSSLSVVGSGPASSSTSVHADSSDDPRTTAITVYFRPSPVFDGGLLRGFSVYPAVRAGEFAKLGLQAGDVITAINGVGVTEGEQVMNALEQVVSGSPVQATIERSGQTRTITLDGSVITAEYPGVAPEG